MEKQSQFFQDDPNVIKGDENYSEVIVLVMDLFDEQAMSMAAQMSVDFPEVSDGLLVAREVQMHLLLVAMTRSSGSVSCIPVTDYSQLSQALQTVSGMIRAHERSVSWVMVPETIKQTVTKKLEEISSTWDF